MRALWAGRRGTGGAGCAKPQRLGAFDRLYAENVDRRDHRRLRALSELTKNHDVRNIAGTPASAARHRLDADAVPELGFQPDRGQTGAAGHSAAVARLAALDRRP